MASRGTDLVLFAVHGRRLRARAVARLAQMRSMMPPREPVRLVDLHVARLAQMRAVVIAVHDRPRGVAEVAGGHTRAGFRGRRRPRGVQDDALERAFRAALSAHSAWSSEFPEGWITPRRGPRRWTRARARPKSDAAAGYGTTADRTRVPCARASPRPGSGAGRGEGTRVISRRGKRGIRRPMDRAGWRKNENAGSDPSRSIDAIERRNDGSIGRFHRLDARLRNRPRAGTGTLSRRRQRQRHSRHAGGNRRVGVS